MTVLLSPAQRQIVEAPDGPMLVRAGAGSGKTRVLTERIRYVLGRSRKKVLALTFTNAAAQEMRERLSEVPSINDRAFIGTFHGFCERVLINHGASIGLAPMPHIFDDYNDRLGIVDSAIAQTPLVHREYYSRSKKERSRLGKKVLDFISRKKRNLITPEIMIEKSGSDANSLVYVSYQDILTSQNAIDFDDLLLFTHRLFTDRQKIAGLYRRVYEHICVDEAQDLNNAQYAVLRAMTSDENKNVVLVGDPNQSIYAFNGSSSSYMTTRFVQDFHPKVYELSENYRSTRSVLQAASRIIPDPPDLEHTVLEGHFEIHEAAHEEDEAEWILEKVKSLIAAGRHADIENPIRAESIAILARNKYVFSSLDSKLETSGLTFSYKKAPGPVSFESREMQAFYLGLRLKLNPLDSLAEGRLASLAGCEAGVPGTEQEPLDWISRNSDSELTAQVIRAVTNLDSDGRNLRQLMSDMKDSLSCNVLEADVDRTSMVLNDIDDLLSHWNNYAKATGKRSLLGFRNALALGYARSKKRHEGLTLSTVHTMKGQEYDIVFVMGMDDGTFPDYRAIRAGGLEMKQEINNAYVAFTRSRRLLYVSWPKARIMPWGKRRARTISRILGSFSA